VAKNNPNSNKKSGGLGFIITLLILSSLFHFSLGGIIAGVLVGLGIGKITSIMGSGLDTTTHNKRDREREAREEAEKQQLEQRQRALAAQEAEKKKREDANRIPLTGDKIADQVITTGQDMLETIRKENAAIPDQELSKQMDDLSIKCEQIFRTVSESPAKAPQVRKFMNYYLPTTLKMLANYRTMEQRGVSYGEMKQARETTVHGMNLILTACQKQIDNLHRENMLDISTDIDVLEQMLKRDGFTDNEIVETARTAAEAQMRSSSAPVMDFPVEPLQETPPVANESRVHPE
jgi:5-bromo-4-chloroindolyl phosphate hydrolysis protein